MYAEREDTRIRAVFEAVEAAQSARTLGDLEDIMERSVELYGFTGFSFAEVKSARSAETAAKLAYGRTHEAWRTRYLGEQHYLRDITVVHALTRLESFSWSDARAASRLSKAQRLIFDEAREFGLNEGFITPIHHLDGSAAAVTLSAESALTLSAKDRAALQMLCFFFSSAGRHLVASQSSSVARPHLTPRQVECLQWVRQGKTNWEIGQILGISEARVRDILYFAMKALGTHTRGQAVIQAATHGLIAL